MPGKESGMGIEGFGLQGRDWMIDAKCPGMEPSLFYVGDNVHTNSNNLKNHARALCWGCPVYVECAEDAKLYGDTQIIRAGIPLGVSQRKNREALDRVIAEGLKPPVARPSGPKRVCDRSTPWSEARCSLCSSSIRPQGVLLEDAPGTKVAHNKSLCQPCYRKLDNETKDQVLINRNTDKRNRWENRKCKVCSTAMRPRNELAKDWPDTVEIHTDNTCKKCHRAEVAAAQPDVTRLQAQKDWADRKCIHCDSYLRPPTPWIEDFPDTKPAHSKEVCLQCHRTTSRNDQPLPSTA